MKLLRQKTYVVGTSLAVLVVGGFFGLARIPSASYIAGGEGAAVASSSAAEKSPDGDKTNTSGVLPTGKSDESNLPPVTHISAPEQTKGIYITSCVAGTPSWRERLMNLVETTELNAVVVDIKDYSGTIAFTPKDPLLKDNGGTGCRAKDMRKFVAELHEKGIYTIGRVTVFQDPYYTKAHPELAVKKLSDGTTWKDRKGLSFVDVGARPFWDYIMALSKESHDMGFDEINFDYVRFPSDGDMKDINFTWSKGKTKAEALREFFEYLSGELRPTGMALSVDLFGMVTTNYDDLNIGQLLENALPYFDYIDPMVYPSHYPTGFNGYKNVNAHPYDIVKFSLDRAVKRTIATTTTLRLHDSVLLSAATGTKPAIYSKTAYPASKIRPWLQDFSYPVTYTPEMVKAQIQATNDAGLKSWLMWDPANKYTISVYGPE